MNEEIHNLFGEVNRLSEILKTSIAANMDKGLKEIEKIKDEKTKEYFKNAVSLARENKLDLTGFLENSKNFIDNACRDTSQ